MAQLLVVFNAKSAHADAEKDKMRYKRGDIVDVYPSSIDIEEFHNDCMFVLIKVPSMSVQQIHQYKRGRYEEELDGGGDPQRSNRRKYGMKLSLLPVDKMAELQNNKRTTISKAKFLQCTEDRKTRILEG